jgi:DegV family protein with EDD domain
MAGNDVLYIGMSSGISGAFGASAVAAREAGEKYPQRRFEVFDTKGASLGEGLLVLAAQKLQKTGADLSKVLKELDRLRTHMMQVFTVDDLMYLRRGGRISGASAIVGTMLSIKPMLKGNEKGQIVAFGKIRGRRNSVKAIADNYNLLVKNPQEQMIGIAHADCQEDVDFLISMLNEKNPPKEILTVCYEPVTGSHVGPGGLALFFFGSRDYRSSWKYGK